LTARRGSGRLLAGVPRSMMPPLPSLGADLAAGLIGAAGGSRGLLSAGPTPFARVLSAAVPLPAVALHLMDECGELFAMNPLVSPLAHPLPNAVVDGRPSSLDTSLKAATSLFVLLRAVGRALLGLRLFALARATLPFRGRLSAGLALALFLGGRCPVNQHQTASDQQHAGPSQDALETAHGNAPIEDSDSLLIGIG
jgi:hypothetical protein